MRDGAVQTGRQGSLPGTGGTERTLSKSRVSPGDLRKMAWNAQSSGLRGEGRTKGKRKRHRGAEIPTVGGPGGHSAGVECWGRVLR